MFVAPDDPVKLSVLTLTNTSSVVRQVSVYGYVEWCLGPPRAGERRFVVTERDEATGALFARNAYNTEFGGRVAFLRATEATRSFTCDRAEFVGRNRTVDRPAGLVRDALTGRAGAGLDPCAALQVAVEIRPVKRVASPSCWGRDMTRRTPPTSPLATARCRIDAALGRAGTLLGTKRSAPCR